MQKLLITSAIIFSAMILAQDVKATTAAKDSATVNVEVDKAYNEGIKEGAKDYEAGVKAGEEEVQKEMKEVDKEMKEKTKKVEEELKKSGK